MKTVVFAFDALDFRYVDEFASSLPNLSALRDGGVEAPLRSTHPPWTGSAWPSMYTGTDPSHHGVYGFFSYEGYPDEGELVDRPTVRRPALWDYLTSEGAESIVLNVPVTHPADPIEGAMIPGYLAVEDEAGHPEGIREEVSDAIGEEYRIYSRGETSSDPEEKFAGYRDLIDLRRRAAVSLLESREWELAVIQVQKTDAVFHNFDDRDRFRAIYEAADRLVGDVLEVAEAESEPVNAVVCSDHGIGPVDGYTIYVNEVLRRHGYVETSEDGGKPTLESEKTSLTGEATERDGGTTEPGALERTALAAQRVASRIGVEPTDVYAAAERLGLESLLVRMAPDSLREAAGENVDWRRSRAYCPDATRMGVRVNLEGREPKGVVPSEEYEAVRDDLIGILSGLETPDGDPAFEFVCRREEVYDGPYTDRAPDVVFLPTGMDHTVSPTLYGREFVPVEVHDHKPEGVFVGAGPAFAAEAGPDRLSLTDVAPIAMAALERPVPTEMTGDVPDAVLADGVDPERRDYGDVPFAVGDDGPTADDGDGEVTERLEDLGYL